MYAFGPESAPSPLVVGSRGSLGTAVVDALRARGYDPRTVTSARLHEITEDPGLVFYASGLAWGAEERPAEAEAVHVEIPRRFIERVRPRRFVYASSARVYDAAPTTSETAALDEFPPIASVYASTKLRGEQAVLAASPEHRALRFSNLQGPNVRSQLFVPDIIRQSVTTGRIAIRSGLDSAKDYLDVRDAADLMVRIGESSEQQIYNVASGENTTHRAWIDAIRTEIPDVELEIAEGSPTIVAPRIDVTRLQGEFPFRPRDVLATTSGAIAALRTSTPE